MNSFNFCPYLETIQYAGFKEGVNACCGSGPYGGIFSCGGRKKQAVEDQFQLCNDPRDFVWWDSFHPTERIHHHYAEVLWSGPNVCPYTLQDLFFDKEKRTIGDLVDDLQVEY